MRNNLISETVFCGKLMSIPNTCVVIIVISVLSHSNVTPRDGRYIKALGLGFYRHNHTGKIVLKDKPNEKNIFLTLYTKSISGERVTSRNISKSSFDPKKKTKFILHGWKLSGNSDFCHKIKDGYIKNYDFNVIIVDWGYFAKSRYILNVYLYLKQISRFLVEFVMTLVNSMGLKPEDVHLIGYSLGAHLSGYVGRNIKGLGRITGLDPALPLFYNHSDRLNECDAQFVDVVHTSGGFSGVFDKMGTVDFYFNGGRVPQPGCFMSHPYLALSCSHSRSWKYYAESVYLNKPIWAERCTNAKGYGDNDERYESNSTIFGENISAEASGSFCLKTLPKAPYFRNHVKLYT